MLSDLKTEIKVLTYSMLESQRFDPWSISMMVSTGKTYENDYYCPLRICTKTRR